MYWLDNNTGIPTAPTTPPVISAAKRYFTNGGAGVQPSVPEDFWFNMVTDELLGVLDMAGIAPDKDDLGQLAKAIQAIAFSAYPVGAPIPWPTAVPPSGFLVLNGQSFSTVTYPKLALAYPSGSLPDLRAEFIRGWDNGRGIDAGRALLSSQADSIGPHIHNVKSAQGLISAGSSNYLLPTGSSIGTLSPTSNNEPLGVETRPRNIPFSYIVRAA